MEGRIRALKQWFAFTCFRSLSICLILRWSHIWRATWWLATSAACLALVFSSQIRRYCASWKKELSISENFGGELGKALVECVNVRRHLEHAKASARCSIEWSFHWLKMIYGYAKVRYRGLANNHSRAQTLFALYNCYRLRKWCAPPKLPC